MRETPEQLDSMFPKLEDAQIAQLAAFGGPRGRVRSSSTRET